MDIREVHCFESLATLDALNCLVEIVNVVIGLDMVRLVRKDPCYKFVLIKFLKSRAALLQDSRANIVG